MPRAEGLSYTEFAPPSGLAEIVARYWCVVAPETLPAGHIHRVLPDGCVDLIVVGRGEGFLTLRGPRDTPLDVTVAPGDRFWAARLWPDVGGRLLGVTAKSLRDLQAPVASFVGAEADRLARKIMLAGDGWREEFDAWLTARAGGLSPMDAEVRLVLVAQHAANGALSAGELAELVGLSARQLQRRFSAATGLTIKTYARIRRLRPALGHMLGGQNGSWASVAASLGFSDQSHLIAEFRRLAGASPGEVARYVSSIVHSNVVP